MQTDAPSAPQNQPLDYSNVTMDTSFAPTEQVQQIQMEAQQHAQQAMMAQSSPMLGQQQPEAQEDYTSVAPPDSIAQQPGTTNAKDDHEADGLQFCTDCGFKNSSWPVAPETCSNCGMPFPFELVGDDFRVSAVFYLSPLINFIVGLASRSTFRDARTSPPSRGW